MKQKLLWNWYVIFSDGIRLGGTVKRVSCDSANNWVEKYIIKNQLWNEYGVELASEAEVI